jgi:hypothetical protein
MTLDTIINTIIPFVVFGVVVFIMYKPLKTPIDALGRLILSGLVWIKDRINPADKIELEDIKAKDIYYE